MGRWIHYGQRPGGGDKLVLVGDIETSLESEWGGRQEGGSPGLRMEVTVLCLVSSDQATRKGTLSLRVLSPLSPRLQLWAQTSGPWHGGSPQLPVGVVIPHPLCPY